MKKLFSLLLCAVLVMTVLSGAAVSTSADDLRATSLQASTPNETAFRLSGISDVTGANGVRTYRVYAPYTDTYTLSASYDASVTLSHNGKALAEGKTSFKVKLTENEVYTLEVKTGRANASFTLTVTAQNHMITLPYDVAEPLDVSSFSLRSDGTDPLKPATLNYQKRGGGTYVYSNNPEAIRADAVGKAFIRSEGLTGDVYVTFEHANYSGSPIDLGYQLKNEGDSDVYVTVTNVGYQTSGTWLGQESWYDFYNVAFELPEDYFSIPENKSYYDFQEYTPRVFQPITYRLPAGEYFYVIGGTTVDAYRNINVDKSANRPIRSVACANGNVKFTVTGGSVTGTLYAYRNVSQVKAEPESLGYVTGEYARQYSGRQEHAGVIDNYATWVFSDETKDGALPVTYTTRYDAYRPWETTPYAVYNSIPHTVNAKSWVTHLNPQNDHAAVGTDMVSFVYYDQNGREVVLDNDCADGAGGPGNFGNWMIEYQDHFTLVNQGKEPRSVTFTTKDSGSLAMLVRDSLTGEILQADLTAGIHAGTPNYKYTVVIPPHSVKQITLDYLLLACSYGRVVHTATLGHDTKSATMLGDVNGDWKIDSIDYLLLKRHVLGTYRLTDAQQAVADVSKDGSVSATDYLLMKRHVLGTYRIS